MTTFYKNDANNFLAALQVETPAPAGYQVLDANTSDGAVEKHVPVVEIEHADDRLEVHHLKPGQSPVAFFPGGVKAGTVYAYCNLHGLWKAEF